MEAQAKAAKPKKQKDKAKAATGGKSKSKKSSIGGGGGSSSSSAGSSVSALSSADADVAAQDDYFDSNATTPLAPSVVNAVTETMLSAWGNPSSATYEAGRKARRVIEAARGHVAAMVGAAAHDGDILFVSGGTEANNMVIHSAVMFYAQWAAGTGGATDAPVAGVPHVVTSNVEHDSIALALKSMAKQQLIELTEVPVNGSGYVDPADVQKALKDNTVLVTVMLANNETGVIQPVQQITALVKQAAAQRENKMPIFVHTDAAQAIGKIAVDVEQLGVDYLTIVGHKFYGPRIGALYIKGLDAGQTPVSAIFIGGGQERNLRPGTENTPMIAGLGEAARLVKENLAKYADRMQAARDYFELKLILTFGIESVVIHGKNVRSTRLPNTCNFSLVGPLLSSRSILSNVKFCASKGAACHSDDGETPSAILLAMGIPVDVAKNAIRFSVGRDTSIANIDKAIEELDRVVKAIGSGQLKPTAQPSATQAPKSPASSISISNVVGSDGEEAGDDVSTNSTAAAAAATSPSPVQSPSSNPLAYVTSYFYQTVASVTQ